MLYLTTALNATCSHLAFFSVCLLNVQVSSLSYVYGDLRFSNFNKVTITLLITIQERRTLTMLQSVVIALEAAFKQSMRDMERAHARIAALKEENALLKGNRDAAMTLADEKSLQVCMLEEKVRRLQLGANEKKKLKEDRVVREALEKEMQRLHRQSTDLEDSHKDKLLRAKARHIQELNEVETRHKQELKQMEDRLQSMESSLRANRAALNSKETALRVTLARLRALEDEMETKDEEFEDEGAALRARVQILQQQLSRALYEVEKLRVDAGTMKQRYTDDFGLWLGSMNEVLEAGLISPPTSEPLRPATA